MRWADFGPTPGRQRNASINLSNKGLLFMIQLEYGSERKLEAFGELETAGH